MCIASPNAAAAQGDAAEAAFRRKLRHYWHVIPQLASAGIMFRPLVWTADGRPHPAAFRTLRYALNRAAGQRNEQVKSTQLRARWRHEMMTAILRRRAAMVRSVFPRPLRRAAWLLTGLAEDCVTGAGRSAQIDADDFSDACNVDEMDDGNGSLNEGAR